MNLGLEKLSNFQRVSFGATRRKLDFLKRNTNN